MASWPKAAATRTPSVAVAEARDHRADNSKSGALKWPQIVQLRAITGNHREPENAQK